MPNITLNTENTSVDKNTQSLPSVSYEAFTIFCATCNFIGKYHRALVQVGKLPEGKLAVK